MSLAIWHVERCVCVWSSWLSRPISSFTAVTLSSARVCFSLLLSCLWSVLPAPQIFFSKLSRPALLQFVFKNSISFYCEQYSLKWYKLLISALSSLLNGMLHYRYVVTALKIIIYNSIICFCLQTPKVYLKLNIV